ncbi:MAG TPA: efflux RND transporter periplasmic adaptor subunit [Candidatus Eisenbacteria bacterium]|nr:efflux RND transporter periplasmic adaptor subunit [Candidatus Eisenbacteria bacterium]
MSRNPERGARLTNPRPTISQRATRRLRSRWWICLLVPLAAAGCGSKEPAAPPPPEVLVIDVAQRDVPVYGEWVGTTDGYINAQIRAKVQGYLLTKAYQEGSLVKAGDVLFQLDPRQYQAALDEAKGDLARAQANLVRSEQNVARYRPLVEKGAVSRKELDDTVQQARADQASVETARAALENARLNLEWTTVRSPIEGVAGIAQAQVGDLIAPTTLMTTVSQLDPIKVYFPISEQEYLRFAARNPTPDAAANAEANKNPLELILADETVYKHPGRVSAINRQVEVQTGSLQIQSLFPNPDNVLRPGGYAKVRAVTDMRKDAAVVPQRAVREIQGSYQLAVIDADDKATLRPVKVGPKVGSDWVIDEGVKPGERVVAEGIQKVRDGVKVVAKPFTPPAAPVAGGDAKSD